MLPVDTRRRASGRRDVFARNARCFANVLKETLTISQILMLIAYAVGMSGGQLCSYAAIRFASDGTLIDRLFGLLAHYLFHQKPSLCMLLHFSGWGYQLYVAVSGIPVRGFHFKDSCCWEACSLT